MFEKSALLAGVCALLLFVFAQQQGWNLFEDSAQHRAGSGSSRVYHK